MIIEVVTKLGLFFLVAYINMMIQLTFTRYIKGMNLHPSYSPISHLPIFQGILLPIFTTLIFYFPVGFTKNVKNTLLQETDQYLAKLYSLVFQVIFSFFLVIIIKNYTFLIDASDGILLYLAVINLLFIIFNIIPLYPGMMSYWFVYLISSKKSKLDSIYKNILYYKNIGIILMCLFFIPDAYFWILQKIEFHLTITIELSNAWLFAITGFLVVLFSFTALLHRHNLKKYYQKLRMTLEKTLEEDRRIYD